MGQLVVRDLDDELIQRIKKWAALHGRSVEAEHRAILEEAVRPSAESLLETARRFQAELAERVPAGEPSAAEMIRKSRDEHSGFDA